MELWQPARQHASCVYTMSSDAANAGSPAQKHIWSDLFARVATCPDAQDDVLGPLCGKWTANSAASMVEALLTIVECGDRQKAVLAAQQLAKFVGGSVPSYAARFYAVLEAAVLKYILLDDTDAAVAMADAALHVYWPDTAHKTVCALLELAVQSASHDRKATFGNAVFHKTLVLSRNVKCPENIILQLCTVWTELARRGVDVPETLANVMLHCETWMTDIRRYILSASHVTAFHTTGAAAVAADLLAAVPDEQSMYHTTRTLWELLEASDDATLQAVMNINNGHMKTRVLKIARGESSRRVVRRMADIDANAAKEAETTAREAVLAAAETRAVAAETAVARIKEQLLHLLADGGVSISGLTSAETSGIPADQFSGAGNGALSGAGEGALSGAGEGALSGAGEGALSGAGDGAVGGSKAAVAVPVGARADQVQGSSSTEDASTAGC